jgi:hypothetical protein
MFAGKFMFNATREQIAAISRPLLVLRGDDLYHPDAVSRAVVELAKSARLVEDWKEGDALDRAHDTIVAFFDQHLH